MDWIADHSPIIGLIFFVVFFSGVLVWVMNPHQKRKLEEHATIPFKEEA